jgi:hypothetical protein
VVHAPPLRGGVISHARTISGRDGRSSGRDAGFELTAVLARELGIPAVVGVTGARSIPDGATVEVDPAAGEVRILTTS